MAKRAAQLSADEMRAAISVLKLRMAELEAFNPASVKHRNDPRIGALDKKIEDSLAGVFGTDTEEFVRFRPRELDSAGYNMMYETPFSEVIQGLFLGKTRELLNLQTVVDLFEEKLVAASSTPADRARGSFGDIDLHPEVKLACSELFYDGHYSQAVEAACKVLDLLVKMRSMRTEPSGTELMQVVFSPKSPVLAFNAQSNESERSEQQGMMYLFAGAMLAIRNPRAHGLVTDHPERAVEYISFISMLAKALDRARKV